MGALLKTGVPCPVSRPRRDTGGRGERGGSLVGTPTQECQGGSDPS